jgi:hypothetical protein
LGHGLGSTGVSSVLSGADRGIRDFDNGIFAVLYSLGWIAGAGLLVAAVAVVAMTFRRGRAPPDPVISATRATTVSILVLTLGANVLEGATAAVFWSFAGLAVAGYRHAEATRSP